MGPNRLVYVRLDVVGDMPDLRLVRLGDLRQIHWLNVGPRKGNPMALHALVDGELVRIEKPENSADVYQAVRGLAGKRPVLSNDEAA
jgi:hypothetical protein